MRKGEILKNRKKLKNQKEFSYNKTKQNKAREKLSRSKQESKLNFLDFTIQSFLIML